MANNFDAPFFTADSVRQVLTPMREFATYWYVPGIFAYSSLKSSGRLDLIEDDSLRNRMVLYFEDYDLYQGQVAEAGEDPSTVFASPSTVAFTSSVLSASTAF